MIPYLGTLGDVIPSDSSSAAGGRVSCIATNDSTPAVFAAAGDGGKLLVYRHSQSKAIDREMMQP